jgi:enolase
VQSEIGPALAGRSATDQVQIDLLLCELDGTPNLSRLGANALLATSLAVCRAAAAHQRQPLHRYLAGLAGTAQPTLPMPMANILSGGAHAGRGMDLQDFLAVPVGAPTFGAALEMLVRVRNAAAELLQAEGRSVLLADEGGLGPAFAHADEALNLMLRAIERAGLRPLHDVALALDVAASELLRDGAYRLEGRALSGDAMVEFVVALAGRYPLISLEDALDQDDWEHWSALTQALPNVQIVGDDLFATNAERIATGVACRAANAVLVKLNQNGTLSGTLAALATAREAGYATVVSARSGETEDAFIADFAVGTAAGQIKIGSLRTSERLAKYNQLLRIEEDLSIPFAGVSGFAGYRPSSSAA